MDAASPVFEPPGVFPPRQVEVEGLGPVAEVACSSYSTAAVGVDGRVWTWGDGDGDALGHPHPCHRPTRLAQLGGLRVAHASLSYTNGATATDGGRVFVWGGDYWQGGISRESPGRAPGARGPREITWSGVPAAYACSSVALAWKHGFLVFRKRAT